MYNSGSFPFLFTKIKVTGAERMDVCLWENKNFDSNKAWLSRQKMKRIELRS